MNLLDIFNRVKEEETNSLNDRVLIIDGLNTYLRVFSSVPVVSENGEHVGGVVGTLRSIAKEIRDFNPTRCIVVFDGKGGSARRKKLFPQYKENRVGKYSLRREFFASKEEEDMSRHKQLIRVIQYLEYLPVQVVCMDNVEADDVIANMAMQYFNSRAKKIRIVSTDRDFLQLVSEQVEVYSPVKKKLYDLKTLEEEYGIHPKNYLLYRILEADDSDNIPGVSGVGLKTLIKFYPELTRKQLDLEYLINRSSEVISETKKPAKIYQTVLESRGVLERNMALMQLHDTDISANSKVRILEILQQPISGINKHKLKTMLVEDYLHTSFKNFDGWLNSTFNALSLWTTK